MSNDTSKLGELRDDELKEVSGGRYTFENVMVESIWSPRDAASGLPTGLVARLNPPVT